MQWWCNIHDDENEHFASISVIGYAIVIGPNLLLSDYTNSDVFLSHSQMEYVRVSSKYFCNMSIFVIIHSAAIFATWF